VHVFLFIEINSFNETSTPDSVGEVIMFSGGPSAAFVRSFVRSFRHILLPRYITNVLNNFDKTNREYSFAPTDDLIRFWKSNVKGQGHSRLSSWQGIHVDAGASMSIFYFTFTTRHEIITSLVRQ